MPRELTQAIVELWVSTAVGQFNVRDIWAELGIESTENKHHLKVILKRLSDKGIIIPTAKDGSYRKLDSTATPINWQAADPTNILPLKFPFSLEEYVKIYPKSIIIIAGSKSAGKTAWLYNFVYMNMNNVDVDLYNSEMGPEAMKERFEAFGDIPVPAPFNVYERYHNFGDVINPDNVSVIDYLSTTNEAYLCAAEIEAVFQRLRNGAAVIAIQKPPASTYIYRGEKKTVERDLGYGGAYSAFRSQLYVSLGGNKMKLVYGKNPAKKTVNPNNMMWTFSIDSDLIHFKDIKRYYEENEGAANE